MLDVLRREGFSRQRVQPREGEPRALASCYEFSGGDEIEQGASRYLFAYVEATSRVQQQGLWREIRRATDGECTHRTLDPPDVAWTA